MANGWTLGIAWTLTHLLGSGEIPHADEVLAVPEETRAVAVAAHRLTDDRSTRVRDFAQRVSGPTGLIREYDDDYTRTVAETLRSGQGNCLSQTLSFVQLARAAGFRAEVQDVGEALAWDRDEQTVFRTRHVNAAVRQDMRWHTVDFDPDLIGQRNPRSERISDERALAYFYNNRAVELMVADDWVNALRYARRALEHATDYPGTWNTIGVIYRRAGNEDLARQALERALDAEPQHVPALSNLVRVLEARGEEALAAEYRETLETHRGLDPFHHFKRALDAKEREDYREAAGHIRRAIRMHDDEHRFHYAAFRIHQARGHEGRAWRALERAREQADDRQGEAYAGLLDEFRD